MTRDEAIEQLDWYFEQDDGIAADPVTKEAYKTIHSIAMSYGGCASSSYYASTIVCPVCRGVAGWNSYFGCYRCGICGWDSREKGA